MTAPRLRGLRPGIGREDLEELIETYLPELSRMQLLWPRDWTRMPAVDLVEKGDYYFLTAELPGVTKENLEISIVDTEITLKGTLEKPSEETDEVPLTRERLYGDFLRRVRLPTKVEADTADARLENGLLFLKVAKARDVRPRRVEIRSLEPV